MILSKLADVSALLRTKKELGLLTDLIFFFLCCRSYDRDEVLAHVKQHYIDAGLFMAPAPPSTPPMINIPLPQKLDLMEAPRVISNLLEIMPNITVKPPLALMPNGEPNSTDTASSSMTPAALNAATSTTNHSVISSGAAASLITTPPSALNSSQPITATITANSAATNAIMDTGLAAAASSSFTTDHSHKSSSLITTTSNSTTPGGSVGTGQTTGSNGWRGHTAPYRCGHCHQVSNWKHVIQVFLLTTYLHT